MDFLQKAFSLNVKMKKGFEDYFVSQVLLIKQC